MATVLTYIGEEWSVDKLMETDQTLPQWLGWGSGAGVSSKADADLFTPESEARVQCALTKVGAGQNATLQIVGTQVAATGKTITNAGLFTLVANGKLVVHLDHAGVPLDAGDEIEYTVILDPQ